MAKHENGRELNNAIDPIFEDDAESGYLFTDLSPLKTGLPFVVYVGYGCGVNHDIRIWTAPHSPAMPSEMRCFALRPTFRLLKGTEVSDRDLALLQWWVNKNLDLIERCWNGECDSAELIANTRSIHG